MFQIIPSEIEDVIDKHPAVKNVCVVRVPDKESGEVPLAWVVLKDGMKATEQDIEKTVKGKA